MCLVLNLQCISLGVNSTQQDAHTQREDASLWCSTEQVISGLPKTGLQDTFIAKTCIQFVFFFISVFLGLKIVFFHSFIQD